MIRVATAQQTCGSHPAQWEGETEDGEAVYARFRHGCLTVGVGPTLDDAVDAAMGKEAPGRQLVDVRPEDRGACDSCLSPYELADLTADVVEWPWSRDPR